MNKHCYLTPVLGGPGAPRYAITEERQLIGRSEKASIPLLEPTVSREHAAIQIKDGEIYLEDLGSKHGTFVNSRRISNTQLKVGDIVVFGLSLVLRVEESEQPVQSSSDMRIPSPHRTLSAGNMGNVVNGAHGPTLGGIKPSATKSPLKATSSVSAQETTQLKQHLAKTRKLATVGALCAATLPDIQAKLSAFVESLHENTQVNASQLKQALDPILNDLTELLSSTKLSPPKLEPVSVFDVVRRAIAIVAPEATSHRVDLLMGVSTDINAMAEPTRLMSAIVEILRNATAASSSGSAVEINAKIEGGIVEITIVDQGEGIPPDLHQRVFDPFVTFKPDWARIGLGLFEARQIIASFGGTLFLDSKPRLGTTIRICLRAS